MRFCVKKSFVVISALLFGITHTASAAIWFVATNGNDNADGTSWETAKETIQAAIDLAVSNDTVLVSNGLYATGGRVVHGTLTNRVVIDRPITVLSANGPESTIINGAGPMFVNAMRCVYIGTNAVLSGFTLTGGTTRCEQDTLGLEYSGGGAWCEENGKLTNCILSGNAAGEGGGGGVYGGTLFNCTLRNNSMRLGDRSGGGGAAFSTLNNCTLTDNQGWFNGGGAYACTLDNCILLGNSAIDGGGAHGSTLYNCTLLGNSSWFSGGGAAACTLNNCILVGNSSYDSGGGASHCNLYNCIVVGNRVTGYDPEYGVPSIGGGVGYSTLRNCIIYGNSATNGPNHFGCEISFSCTTPDPGGMGNITNEPQFVDAAAGNYRLSTNSPCIDRGANFYVQSATDLDGNPRIMNGGVDMGAYECQEAVAPRFGYWAWAAGITNGLTNYADCATGDEYPNLLKYASGSGATNTDDLARLADGLSNGLFRVRFNRNTNAQDVIIVVECSSAITNCAAWQGVATNFLGSWGGATNVEEFGDGSPVAVAVSEIEPTSNRIFRLRVHRP